MMKMKKKTDEKMKEIIFLKIKRKKVKKIQNERKMKIEEKIHRRRKINDQLLFWQGFVKQFN